MLTRTINYEDFDGNQVSENHSFHLSKSELLLMDVEHKEGLGAILEEIIKTEDKQGLVIQFKKIILAAYGKREGSRFIKTPELTEEFSQTAAFDALFMELVTDDAAAEVFVKGIIPRDLNTQQEQLAQIQEIVQANPNAAMISGITAASNLPAPPLPTSTDL